MNTSRDDYIIAIRSAFLQKNNQQRFSLLSLILFSIIFLVLGSYNSKIINFNKTIIKEIVYFSSFIVTIPENIVKKSTTKVTDHFRYYDNYQVIKSELKELKNKDLSKKIISYENIELKKLIDDYFIEDSQAYAKVLIDKKSKFLRSIIINKGSNNGIKVGMVIYDNIYLIGKVVEVNFLTSRVLLISDINSKVPVTIQPLNIEAIMSGINNQNGMLQYIKSERLINKNYEELIVVTSGSGEVFKSGTPIGKIDATKIFENKRIMVNFYSDLSQLKYVKVLSHSKENINIDKSNKYIFDKSSSKTLQLNNLTKELKLIQQQKIINDDIRIKFEKENTYLKKNFIDLKKKLEESNSKIKVNKLKNERIQFLELNLLYGHKCRKSFLKPQLFSINTDEYKICVMKKEQRVQN
jgi:rod shape-determining protein MreC